MEAEHHDLAGRLARGWVRHVVRHARWVVLAILALTVVSGIYVVRDLGINTSDEDMLSSKLPFRQNSVAMDKAFPELSSNLVVVLDSDNPDALADAATALRGELGKYPDLLGDVYDPEGEDVLRKGGLLFLDTDELSTLLDRLVTAQPFIGKLWNDPTLAGLFGTLQLILDQSDNADAAAPAGAAGDLFRSVATAIERQTNGLPAQLSWRRLFSGDTAAPKRDFRALILKPKLDYGELQPATQAIAKVREIIAASDVQGHFGVRARLTGSVAMEHEELQTLSDNVGLASVLSFLLTGVLLAFGMRSTVQVTATMITLFVGLVLTAGWATLAVGELNLISVAFAILFIGLGEDFGVHFCLRQREELAIGAGTEDALVAGAEEGGALTLSAATAAIAFFSFVPTDYKGLAELGIIAGGGMFIALFANLTLLPALLALWPVKLKPAKVAPPTNKSWDMRKLARPCAIVITLFTIVSLFIIPKVRFDFDPLNLRDRHTESVSTLFDMMDSGQTDTYSVEVLSPDLTTAQAVADKMSALPGVERAITLASFVPQNQDEKLGMIESASFALSPALATPPIRTTTTEVDRLQAITALRHSLMNYLQSHANDPLAPAAKTLLTAVDDFATTTRLAPEGLTALEHTLTSGLAARLVELRDSLQPAPITLDNLPTSIRSREVAPDGRARVEVFPKDDLRDRDKLRAFVDMVRTVSPDAGGSPVVILEAGRAVIKAFIQAGIWSFLGITLLTFILLRRVRDIILIYTPLVFAAILTIGVTVAFDMPFNFANVIVLPLLFGLGIASGIHLVMREREGTQTLGVAETSTPRAIVYSTLTTIGSFGNLGFSDHPGTQSMGILLTVAILLTLVCSLTVLPVLLERWPVNRGNHPPPQ